VSVWCHKTVLSVVFREVEGPEISFYYGEGVDKVNLIIVYD
jgi:hypothetical protein